MKYSTFYFLLSKFFIFVLIFVWIFSGFPRIWQNPPIPPEIQEARAAWAIQEGEGAVTGIGTAETTLATTTTTFASGVTLVVFARVELENTDTVASSILAGNVKLKAGATVLDDNQFRIEFSEVNAPRAQDDHHLILMAKRVTAAANETFTVTGLASATGVNAQAKISAMQVNAAEDVDAAVASPIAITETTLATASTTFIANTTLLVLSRIQLNDAVKAHSIVAGNLRLKTGATILHDNPLVFRFGNDGGGDESEFALLAARRVTAAANETFTTTALVDVAGGSAQVRMIAVPMNNIQVADPASAAVGATETTLTTLTTTFSTGALVWVLSIVSYNNTNANERSIAAGNTKLKTGATILDDSGAKARLGENDQGADKRFMHGYAAGRTTAAANEVYTVTALASATGINGQALIIAASISNFEQSAYRLFNNLNSTDVGTVLAATNTPATLGSAGAAFRLRTLLHISASDLAISGENFKLQFAQQSGTCDTGFAGETYADVTAATVIAYNDQTPADGAALTGNVNDPTHGAGPDTNVNQTYEELNNFTNSVAAIPATQDGKWDFALKDNGATASTAYCFRVVKSDAAVLDIYTVIPQITTAAAGNTAPTVSGTRLFQQGDSWGSPIDLTESATVTVYITATTTDTNGWADVTSATATAYRSSVSGGASCSVDNNNCYQISSGNCSLGAPTTTNTVSATCTVSFWFYAEPTDTNSPWASDIWTARFTATDSVSNTGSATNSAETIEVNTLSAFDITSSINYGALNPLATSASSQIIIATTTGNASIDVQLSGQDMVYSSYSIAVGKQQYATSSLGWQEPPLTGAVQLTGGATCLELESAKPTQNPPEAGATDQIFWRLGVPGGTAAGAYTGTTTATAAHETTGCP